MLERKSRFISALLFGVYVSLFFVLGTSTMNDVQAKTNNSVQQQVQREVTFLVGNYTNDSITVNGQLYRFNMLAKQLFTKENEATLKGAEIVADVKGDVVVRVKSVKLQQSGTQNKLLQFQTPISVEQLIVEGSYINIKNMSVKSNVVVTNKAAGHLIFDNVFIGRELVVAALGAKEAVKQTDIRFVKAPVRQVVVERDGVQVTTNRKIPGVVIAPGVSSLQLHAQVTRLTIENSPAFTLNGTTTIHDIVVQRKTKLSLNNSGVIQYVTFYDRAAQLQLAHQVRVNCVEMPPFSQVTQIIQNITWSQQLIGKMVVGGALWKGTEVDKVQSLHISSLPVKMQYISTDKLLDLTGLTVIARNEKGGTSVLTHYAISAVDFTKVGQQTVTISYGGQTASFTITINPPASATYTAVGTITGLPTGVSYQSGSGRLIFTTYTSTSFTFKDGATTKKVELVKGQWTISTVK